MHRHTANHAKHGIQRVARHGNFPGLADSAQLPRQQAAQRHRQHKSEGLAGAAFSCNRKAFPAKVGFEDSVERLNLASLAINGQCCPWVGISICLDGKASSEFQTPADLFAVSHPVWAVLAADVADQPSIIRPLLRIDFLILDFGFENLPHIGEDASLLIERQLIRVIEVSVDFNGDASAFRAPLPKLSLHDNRRAIKPRRVVNVALELRLVLHKQLLQHVLRGGTSGNEFQAFIDLLLDVENRLVATIRNELDFIELDAVFTHAVKEIAQARVVID